MAAIVQRPFGSQSHFMARTTGVGQIVASEMIERLVDGLGLRKTGGGIIKIHHG